MKKFMMFFKYLSSDKIDMDETELGSKTRAYSSIFG